jgi:hypothetical protein
MKIIPVVILVTFIFGSCSKESVSPTDAQLTATKIQNDITQKAGKLTYIGVFSATNGALMYEGTAYSITSDGFIYISNNTSTSTSSATFNLGQLKFYQIFPGSLDLYF